MHSNLVLTATLALLAQVGTAALGTQLPAAAPTAASSPVEYVYRIEFADNEVSVSARFRVRENRDFAFVTTLSGRAVMNLVLRDSAGKRPVRATDEPGVYQVNGLRAGLVEASYNLPPARSCGQGPCGTAAGTVVPGADVLLFPVSVDADAETTVQLDFLMPQEWTLVSAGGTLDTPVTAPTLAALGSRVYLAGDQLTTRLPSGELVVVQTAGWEIGAEAVADLIGAALGEQEHLLGRLTAAEARPLIRVTPHTASHSDAIATATPGVIHLSLDGRSGREAMAHQLVGPLTALYENRLAAGLAGAEGESMQWWRLGFTRYTATLAAVRAGSISEEQFIDALMQAWRLTSADAPSGGRVSLAKAGDRVGDDAQRLLSAGGFLTCFLLDTRLRAATGGTASLSTLMARTQGHRIDNNFLHDEIARLAGRDAGDLFRTCVLEETPPPLPEQAALAGLELVDAGTGEPFIGFSLAEDEPVIQHVFAAGPAHAMGLRAGDRITAVNGEQVGSVAQIRSHLTDRAPGDAIGISVRTDDGQVYSAVLKLWERTETVLRRAEQPGALALSAWADLIHGEGTAFAN